MDKLFVDQAEGLRRMLREHTARVVAVTGGSSRVGRTSTVVNLAASLCAQGQDVLVIDECLGPNSVSVTLGMRGAGSHSAVMNGEVALADVPRHPLGFPVLAVSPYQSDVIGDGHHDLVLGSPADIVLIDARIDRRGGLSSLASRAHDALIVTRVAAQAVTETYACMKRLHFAYGFAQFRVLRNQVSDAKDAKTVIDTLTGVAGRFLAVQVEDAGRVAADPQVARAVKLSRRVVDAFPTTPAARDFRRLASEMLYWPMHGEQGLNEVPASPLSWQVDEPVWPPRCRREGQCFDPPTVGLTLRSSRPSKTAGRTKENGCTTRKESCPKRMCSSSTRRWCIGSDSSSPRSCRRV